jgi:tetratricopeptide (TPR) repeat protein
MTRPGSAAQKGTATVLALWLTIFGALAVWIAAQRATDRVRVTWPEAYPLLLLPNGRYLRAASVGFQVLLADTIYLWSIQYYGHRRTPEGRRYLWQIYTTITDLDPQFIDAYTTGALVMASDMSDPGMALELLDLGIERNPDSWLLPTDAGWYCYLNIGDSARAERYFELASQKPGAPSYVERLRAHMAVERGDLLSAIVLWEEIRDEAEASGDEQAAAIASQRVPDLYSQWAIGELDKAIAAFEQEQGRRPDSLALLARLGRLPDEMFVDQEGRPLNYFEEPFNYDARTGEVTDPRAEQARTGR